MPAPNDAFANAATLTFPATISADNTGATTEPGEPTPPIQGSPLDATLWWTFTAAASGALTVEVTAQAVGMGLVLWHGTALAGLALPVEAYTNNAARTMPRVIAFVCQGETYQLQAGSRAAGTAGPFTFTAALQVRSFSSGWVSGGYLSNAGIQHGLALPFSAADLPALMGDPTWDEIQGITGGLIDVGAIGRRGARLWHWGANVHGERGDGGALTDGSPTGQRIALAPQEILALPDIVAYSARWDGVLALTAGGDLYLWGNLNGTFHTTPLLTLTNVTHCARGQSTCFARTGDGQLWWIGADFRTETGPGTPASSWTAFTGTCPGTVAALVGGPKACYAILADTRVFVAGANFGGELGVGTSGAGASIPVLADSGQTADAITTNARGTYWRRGTAVYWSGETAIPLGGSASPFVHVTTPTLMSLLPPVAKVTNGPIDASGIGLALTVAGELWGWGADQGTLLMASVGDPYDPSSPDDGWLSPGGYLPPLVPQPFPLPSDWTVLDVSCADYAAFLRIAVAGGARAWAQIVGV